MRRFRVLVNGNEYTVAIEELAETGKDSPALQSPREETRSVASQPAVKTPPTVAATKPSPPANGNTTGIVKAALPGTILSIKTSVGDSVVRGQTLLILEAMKMENEIMAPCDGVISEIQTTVGASVNSGDVLIIMS